jgi:long-subunit fatty acid transport protein
LTNDPISSINFGINGDYYFNDRWSLRSAILVQGMGSEYDRFTDNLTYLTIPLNANWHFGSTRKWNLNFGPSIGFLMSAEVNGLDFKEATNPTQIGFNIGIGYKIEISEKVGILIDYQSLSGLNDVLKETPISFRNSHGAFNIGAVIKL